MVTLTRFDKATRAHKTVSIPLVRLPLALQCPRADLAGLQGHH